MKNLMNVIGVVILTAAMYCVALFGVVTFVATLKFWTLMVAIVVFMLANIFVEQVVIPMGDDLDNLKKNVEA